MNLAAELEANLSAFVRGERPLEDLEDWLAAHVQALVDHPDQRPKDLADQSCMLIEDHRNRFLSEDELKQELAAWLAAVSTSSLR